MKSETKQGEIIFNIEEKTIKTGEDIIKNDKYKNNELLKDFSKLLKQYKKLFKQLKNLLKMSDRQQSQVNRLNEELVQTNKLLADVSGEKTLKISVKLIRKMSDLASHLMLTKNQLLAFNNNNINQKSEYFEHLENFNNVTGDLQDCIMKTKMQPLALVFASLPKIINNATKNVQKQIKLFIKGENIKIDNAIFDSLGLMLSHLVKNSCEHGIETKQERILKKKDQIGYISISALKNEDQILIEVDDDGKGIDINFLKSKAIENGISETQQHDFMNDNGILELTTIVDLLTYSLEKFKKESGFQIINQKIKEIGGNVKVQTTNKQGIKFILKFPESLSIISGLIVEASGHRFIIPQSKVEELISLYDSEIYTKIELTPEQEVYRLRDKLIPIIRLSEIINKSEPFTTKTRNELIKKYSKIKHDKLNNENLDEIFFIAVLKTEYERFGLVIDKIIGTEEFVFIHLHSIVKHLKIYSGLSIMRDGRVSMIIDPGGIFKHAGININNFCDDKKELVNKNFKLQRILLFKSGEKEQFAVMLSMIHRIVRITKEEIQYKANTPYAAIDGEITRLIILDKFINVSKFKDIDTMYLLMPRYLNKTIAILISGLGGVHSLELNIDTNSHMEEGILGTMKINDIITVFLDTSQLAQMAEYES